MNPIGKSHNEKPAPTRFRCRDAWLAGFVASEPRLSARFACCYARLRSLKYSQRRLFRRVAGTLAGAALLLAVCGAPARAATIVVVNGEVAILDNGSCSLAEAIANANDSTTGRPYDDCAAGDPSGPDTINLPAGGLFSLPKAVDVLYGPTGLPAVETEFTIQGNGSTITHASDKPFRILAVTQSGDLTIHNVILKDGDARGDYGGAVLAYGDLTILNSTISGSSAKNGGALFANGGEVSISDSRFIDNEGDTGSNVSFYFASVIINDTTLSGGQGTGGRGGGGVYLLETNASIANSTISGNGNAGGGGGIMAAYSTLNLSSSVVSDNEAPSSYGGGLYLYQSRTTIVRSTISGNSSATGGGIYQYQGSLTLSQSLIAGNEATTGGGLMNGKGTMTVANSTISGNAAAAGGGVVNQSLMAIDNVTITGNNATNNGGGFLNLGGTAEATLRRSLVAGNTAGGQGREVFHAGKSFAGNHFNLFGFNGNNGLFGFTPGGDSFTPPGTLASVLNPALANNGGPTQTHALASGSPAIDRSPSTDCMAAPVSGVDQRGQPRNQNADTENTNKECDVGAFEAAGTVSPTWSVFVPNIHRP
jgi:hypothetical protein